MRQRLILIAVITMILLATAACGAAEPTPTPKPPPTSPPPAPPTATPLPTEPAAPLQMVAGEKAFNNYCGGCHSAGFDESRLIRYRSADTLFEFLRMHMPPGNPESLLEERHYDITAYLLAEAGLIESDLVVSADTAASIVLTEPGEPPKPEQVMAGEKAFGRYCGSCHGGGFSKSRIERFGTAEKLFGFLRMSMPPGNPEQVSEQGHYDIAAFMLAEHGLLESGEVVDSDTAAGITFGE